MTTVWLGEGRFNFIPGISGNSGQKQMQGFQQVIRRLLTVWKQVVLINEGNGFAIINNPLQLETGW